MTEARERYQRVGRTSLFGERQQCRDAAPRVMKGAIQLALVQCVRQFRREPFGGDRAIDHRGLDRDAAFCEIAGEITRAVLARKIEEPRRTAELTCNHLHKVIQRAISRHRAGEPCRARRLRGPASYRKARQSRQLAGARMFRERARRVRAGHQHAIVWPGELRLNGLH